MDDDPLMAKDLQDWENGEWDEAAQDLFWKKFRRSSARRYEILQTKARLLFKTGEANKKAAACQLLQDVVVAYEENRDGICDKQKYPKSYKACVVDCAHTLGKLYLSAGDTMLAERAMLSHCEIYLDDYAHASPHCGPQSLLSFPRWLTTVGRFDEARERIDTFQQWFITDGIPPYLLRFCGYAWAHYGEHTGDFSRCDKAFRELHEPYDVPVYEELEQRPVLGPEDVTETNPEGSAETIITYHHMGIQSVLEKSRQSLVDLDFHLGIDAPSLKYQIADYKREFLVTSFAPQLGAYFGEVLRKQLNGEWEVAKPQMRSRIKLGSREINPFLIGYNVTFRGRHLVWEFDQIAAIAEGK